MTVFLLINTKIYEIGSEIKKKQISQKLLRFSFQTICNNKINVNLKNFKNKYHSSK